MALVSARPAPPSTSAREASELPPAASRPAGAAPEGVDVGVSVAVIPGVRVGVGVASAGAGGSQRHPLDVRQEAIGDRLAGHVLVGGGGCEIEDAHGEGAVGVGQRVGHLEEGAALGVGGDEGTEGGDYVS